MKREQTLAMEQFPAHVVVIAGKAFAMSIIDDPEDVGLEDTATLIHDAIDGIAGVLHLTDDYHRPRVINGLRLLVSVSQAVDARLTAE